MPIIGSSVDGIQATVGTATCEDLISLETPISTRPPTRALAWSHSEVFVTSYGTLTPHEQLNVADLTTVYTPDPSCIDRWMLLRPQPCNTNSTAANILLSVNPARSIVSDALYNKCQLYGTATYSPGVCPSGQTVAEITAWQSDLSNGTKTFWQASCCRSGMTFGPENADFCLSSFSTPISAHTVITTTTVIGGEISTPVDTRTTVFSSITTITTGIAAADPVIVAWQIDDVATFPSEYVKSLVARWSIPAPTSTYTPTTNMLEPTTAPASHGLSTGTRVGVGVGVALAAALVGGLLIFWCLRRRRKAASTEEPGAVIPEMEDQDHTHTERKWYFGGRWRSEVDAQPTQSELDSKAVHVVPGPPAELEAHEPAAEGAKIAGNVDGRV